MRAIYYSSEQSAVRNNSQSLLISEWTHLSDFTLLEQLGSIQYEHTNKHSSVFRTCMRTIYLSLPKNRPHVILLHILKTFSLKSKKAIELNLKNLVWYGELVQFSPRPLFSWCFLLTKYFRTDNYQIFVCELSPHVAQTDTLVDLTYMHCKYYFVLSW